MTLLITGGSGCGKSTYAEKLIGRMPEGRRVYIATMQVYADESVSRVAQHSEQSADKGFETLECPKDLAAAPVPAGSTVLLEDLPNLLANEMFDGGDPERILPALKALSLKCENLIIVTNDVFSDGVSYPPSTQAYLIKLAGINQEAAKRAECVIEVVYSIPLALKGALPCA